MAANSDPIHFLFFFRLQQPEPSGRADMKLLQVLLSKTHVACLFFFQIFFTLSTLSSKAISTLNPLLRFSSSFHVGACFI